MFILTLRRVRLVEFKTSRRSTIVPYVLLTWYNNATTTVLKQTNIYELAEYVLLSPLREQKVW